MLRLCHGSQLGLVVCTIRGLRRFVSRIVVACSDRIRMCVMPLELGEKIIVALGEVAGMAALGLWEIS